MPGGRHDYLLERVGAPPLARRDGDVYTSSATPSQEQVKRSTTRGGGRRDGLLSCPLGSWGSQVGYMRERETFSKSREEFQGYCSQTLSDTHGFDVSAGEGRLPR